MVVCRWLCCRRGERGRDVDREVSASALQRRDRQHAVNQEIAQVQTQITHINSVALCVCVCVCIEMVFLLCPSSAG